MRDTGTNEGEEGRACFRGTDGKRDWKIVLRNVLVSVRNTNKLDLLIFLSNRFHNNNHNHTKMIPQACSTANSHEAMISTRQPRPSAHFRKSDSNPLTTTSFLRLSSTAIS
jgi:hypothetical protein